MSTIKGKFNIWTVMMFLGCLALAIIITQPILARADNEGHSEVAVDTTFSDAKSMSLDTLNISDSMNVGNIDFSNGKFCNQDGACITLEGDKISVNKIKIGIGQEWNENVILISGNLLYYNDIYGDSESFKLNAINDFINDTQLKERLLDYELLYGNNEIDQVEPARKKKGWINDISFENNNYNVDTPCKDEDNAGTIHYVESSNGSQLIMCMKISNTSYSGVVLREFSNGTELSTPNKP